MMIDIQKRKIETYNNKVFTSFRDLNVQENDIECKYFTVFLLLLSKNKYFLPMKLQTNK